jgi:protein Mpv17
MTGVSLGISGRAQLLWRGYERALSRRPVLVQACTSALLWGAGDVIAQRVAEQRPIEQLDGRRVVATATFGAVFMGPIGHWWYLGLDVLCARLWSRSSKSFLAAKLLADTFIFGPLYVLAFYLWGRCAARGVVVRVAAPSWQPPGCVAGCDAACGIALTTRVCVAQRCH